MNVLRVCFCYDFRFAYIKSKLSVSQIVFRLSTVSFVFECRATFPTAQLTYLRQLCDECHRVLLLSGAVKNT